jgi:hypothetical protein
MSVLCLTFAPTKRDQMERLAYWTILGYVPVDMGREIAAGLSLLDGDEARKWFDDLAFGIGQRDDLNVGAVHPDEVGPEFEGDAVAAFEAASQRVEDALTALAGAA